MKAVGSSKFDDIEVEFPPAMTCIPLEINTIPHRYYVPGVQGLDLYHPFSTIVSPSIFIKKASRGGDGELCRIAI
jgi:hypothetical protein